MYVTRRLKSRNVSLILRINTKHTRQEYIINNEIYKLLHLSSLSTHVKYIKLVIIIKAQHE